MLLRTGVGVSSTERWQELWRRDHGAVRQCCRRACLCLLVVGPGLPSQPSCSGPEESALPDWVNCSGQAQPSGHPGLEEEEVGAGTTNCGMGREILLSTRSGV